MATIAVSGLTFRYDSSPGNIFENVSFQLDTDWKLGFTGRNGRGKTTFLKLLMGEYPYAGSILSPVSFSYFPFRIAAAHDETAQVLPGVGNEYEEWELLRELNLLQVPANVLYRPFDTLSYGERTKVLIASLFLRKNSFLLLDEPTNHLDVHGRSVLAEYLAGKKGFILVSHDRATLDRVVDHVLSINRTDITVRKGTFSSWLEDKWRQDESEADENRRLKKDIARLQSAARRAADWSGKVEASKCRSGPVDSDAPADRGAIGHKAAKMMKRAKAIETRQQAAATRKSALLRNVEETEPLKLSPLAYRAPVLASLSNVSIAYGGRGVVAGVDLDIRRGDRIALLGRNGSGKSSILRLLCGEEVPHSGEIRIGGGLRISYLPQDTSGVSGDVMTFALRESSDRSLFLAILHKLGFDKTLFAKDIRELSEGQRKKVLLARSLSESAHLYLWDEPLNYVDLQSRMQIEALLAASAPTMVFVEHDETFVRNVATAEIRLPGETPPM
jgi:ATPase components of ABC transporters with duplicated ATPase domains